PRPAVPARTERGAPIQESIRAGFEGIFGHTFSAVRIHEDGLAEARGARAVTQGQNIHFAQGEYEPTLPRGRYLLAHELTHVVQQQGALRPRPSGPSDVPKPTDHSLEAEANRVAARVTQGHSVAGTIAGHAQNGAFQHFGSYEHMRLGDEATADAEG